MKKEKSSGWRGITVKGQSVIQYVLPGSLNARMTVNLFLRGSLMKNTEGCPEKIYKALSGNSVDCPKLVAPHQKHGTDLIEAELSRALPERPEADAVLLIKKDIFASLRFADCTPVVGVSEDPFDWCLLVHSGFLGTCRRAVMEAVRKTMDKTGLRELSHSHFWIGPGIGPCCYSRNSDDHLAAIGVNTLPSECWEKDGDKIFFDLPRANIILLYDIGVPEENIHNIDICTSCFADLCHSYRSGDKAERSFLLAGIYSRCHKRIHWWENMF